MECGAAEPGSTANLLPLICKRSRAPHSCRGFEAGQFLRRVCRHVLHSKEQANENRRQFD